jgi:spore coat protein U-like protein
VSARSFWLILGACLGVPAHAACRVTVVNVAFAAYDVFATTDTKSTGTVTVKCAASVAYTISLSAGSGTFASRVMTNGSYRLNYNLFTDSQGLTIWGDGTSGTATVSGTGNGASYTIYGVLPALQNVQTGSYSDTIIVTLTY